MPEKKKEPKPYILINDKEENPLPNDRTLKFKEEYAVGKQIGQGAYASVRVALHRSTNVKVAIKIYEKVKIEDPQRRKSVWREIKVLYC